MTKKGPHHRRHARRRDLLTPTYCHPLEPRLLCRTFYVDPNSPGPTRDALSWATAYTDLQQALTESVFGDVIRIADGTFKPTTTADRSATFLVKRNVDLLGSYAGHGAPNPDARNFISTPTILSGDIGAPNDLSDNAYHVLTTSAGATTTTLLDGLTVTRGNANGAGNDSLGGGLFANASTPTILNCAFYANSAVSGGAIAIANTTAGPTTASITQSLFVGNSATAPTTAGGGGAIFTSSYPVNVQLSTFTANSAAAAGGAVFNAATSSLDISGSILWNDSAPASPEIHRASGAGSTITTYSDIRGNPASGATVLSVDPLFFRKPSPGPDKLWATPDDDFGDLRIPPSSPAADANGNGSSLSTDYTGNPRQQDVPTTNGFGIIDPGAFEAIPALTSTPLATPDPVVQGRPTTLNAYGASNVGGPSPLAFAWDLNNDGLFTDSTATSLTLDTTPYPVGPTPLSLRVTDSAGRSTTSTLTLDILPTTLYVDPRATAGNRSGSSWQNAFTDLQPALAAALPFQSVRVATATYLPGPLGSSPFSTFSLRNDIALLGGYAGLTNPANPDARDFAAHPTVLSGDMDASGNPDLNAFHVVTAPAGTTSTAVLDGFTVTRGSAIATTQDSGLGGAIYFASAAAATINNSTFTQNFGNGAGAVYLNGGNVTFTNCTFANNRSGAFPGGGAVAVTGSNPATFLNCTFTNNTSNGNGGAVHLASISAVFTDCSFSNNTAGSNGGAVYLANFAAAFFTRSSLSANNGTAVYAAGGVISATATTFSRNPNGAISITASQVGTPVPLTLDRCAFFANAGPAAVFTSTPTAITNSLFVANNLAISSSNNSAKIANNSFYANGVSFAGTGAPAVVNCVLWGTPATGGATLITSSNPNLTVTYSDVQGGFTGTGNLNADPLFTRTPSPGPDNAWRTADDDYGDLRPLLTSPLIDAGTNTNAADTIRTDYALHPRLRDLPGVRDPGAILDLGAYERALAISHSTSNANDSLFLTLTSTAIQLFAGASATGTPVATWTRNTVETFTLSTAGGDDAVVLDLDDLPTAYLPIHLDLGAGNDSLTLGLDNNTTSHELVLSNTSLTLSVSSLPDDYPTSSLSFAGDPALFLDTTSTTNFNISARSLVLTGAASLALPTTGNRTLRLNELSLSPTALLDLADNDAVINYPTTGPSPFNAIRAALTAAAGPESLWTAPTGITSSTARALATHQFPGPRTTLALSESALYRIRNNTTAFNGQTVDTTSLILKHTYAADATLDGKVTDKDVDLLYANYQDSRRTQTYIPFFTTRQFTDADFTYDGLTDDRDLDLLASTLNPLAPTL